MFGGIVLNDVMIAVPFDASLDPNAKDVADREFFSAKSLKLIHNPWRLLLGQFQVEQVIATQPTIRLVQNVESGTRNWQLLSSRAQTAKAPSAGKRPEIRLRSAKAIVVSVYADGTRDKRKEELDADVRASSQSETGYYIEVRRFTEPAERTTVIFDPGARLVTNTPYVDAGTVRLQLPKNAQEFFDQVKLKGLVKLDRLVYDAQSPQKRDTEIRLREVRAEIPLTMLRRADAGLPTSRAESDEISAAIEMTHVSGLINLEGTRTNLDVSGLVNDAACEVTGWIDRDPDAPGPMGMELHIDGKAIPAPVGPLRERIRTDASLPDTLRAIIHDYDPRGLFDISFRVSHQGTDAEPYQFSGSFWPKGASGQCVWFPYPLDDIQGEVEFVSPHVLLKGITARHGEGTVRLKADIDRSTEWSKIDIDVQGDSIPLDKDLHAALSEEYRTVWDRFSPVGNARIDVKLHRPPGHDPAHIPDWESQVTADLKDVKMTFKDYPYPLDHVAGRLEFTNNRIDVRELLGKHGDATISLKGYATTGSAPRDGEFQLDARQMELDDALAKALPPEGRAAFRQFRPEGRADLAGTIRLIPGDEALTYDLRAKLRDAAICYDQFPFRIENVHGEIHIRPDAVSVLEMTGRHGQTKVAVTGRVQRRPNGAVADLDFVALDLALDEGLYSALPPALKRAWDVLQPRGRMSARTSLHYVSEDEHVWQRHRTEMDITNASACFRGFPVPLEDVSARVIVNDERVEIVWLKGRAANGTVELSGIIDLDGPGQRGVLVVKAEGFDVGKALLDALPKRISSALVSINPQGRFGLKLDPLIFEVDADGRTKWNFNGSMNLEDASCELGLSMKKLDGRLTGNLQVNQESQVSVHVTAAVKRGTLGVWDLENAVATITKQADSEYVSITDAAAHAYEGQATGSAELRVRPNHVDYQAQIVARDVQLGLFLQSISPESDSHAEGEIAGNLILQGRTGPSGYREGAGEIFIRRAQVWKMPLIFALFQVVNLTPDENVFHDGWLQFFLSRDVINFQTIELRGAALSFEGGGTMVLPDYELDVMLVAASSSPLRLPILTEILEGATSELMHIRMTGTVSKPTIRPQPLSGIAKAIKKIFPAPMTPVEPLPAQPPPTSAPAN